MGKNIHDHLEFNSNDFMTIIRLAIRDNGGREEFVVEGRDLKDEDIRKVIQMLRHFLEEPGTGWKVAKALIVSVILHVINSADGDENMLDFINRYGEDGTGTDEGPDSKPQGIVLPLKINKIKS